MKKIFTLLISVILIFTLSLFLSVTAFATTETDTEVEFEEKAEVEKSDTGANVAEENPFREIYEVATNNADKILSALAFISSLALMIFYKKGLFPILTRSLSGIKSSTGEFKEILKEGGLKTEESLNFLLDKFAFFENTINEISGSLEELGERLEKTKASSKSQEEFKTVMLSQVELLYEIFMQSSLPQYSKDAVGEKVSEMKKRLLGGEGNV